MSHVHAGDDESWDVSVTHPDDGDNADAASVNVPFEAANDGLAYLAARVLTWQPSGASAGALGQKVALHPGMQNTPGAWVETYDMGTYAVLGWLLNSVAGTPITFEVVPPHAMARLASVRVRIDGKAGVGHGASLPANPCRVVIAVLDDGAVDSSTSTPDPSATAAAYDQPHNIDCVGPDNDPLRAGRRLAITVIGENGANSVADTTMLLDITCTWTSEDVP